MITEKTNAIAAVCRALATDSLQEARILAREQYAFAPEPIGKRNYGPVAMTAVFARDGFIDGYSGDRLIHPPVLRVLSQLMPEEFPYHPNWKTDITHASYWEVGATLDHLVPVSRGGPDKMSNWMTTSMVRNSAKMNWTLEELGWRLHEPGTVAEWDGMLGWFLEIGTSTPEVLKGNLKQWLKAAQSAAV